MAAVDVEPVRLGERLGAVAEDQDVFGIVGQQVKWSTNPQRSHRASLNVHGVEIAGGHEEVDAN